MTETNFNELLDFLRKVPSVEDQIGTGFYEDQNWWVKLKIDISNDLSWNVVQEFGHVLNYISLNEKLPVAFYPVSAPPYLNGGPQDYLFWIIESKQVDFTATDVKEWLAARLPDPVENIEEWTTEE